MAFRLRTFIATLIIIGTMTTGVLTFSGGIFDQYDATMDTSPLGDQANETFRGVENVTDESQEAASDIGGGIAENLFILKSIWNVLALTLDSITSVIGIFGFLNTQFGVPEWFVALMTSVVTVFVVYELVSLYRGIRS